MNASVIVLVTALSIAGCATGGDTDDPTAPRGKEDTATTDTEIPTLDSSPIEAADDATPPSDETLPPPDSSTPDCEKGAKITGAAEEKWSWVAVPEAKCGKGAGLGIAINPTSKSKKLLIFLNGGGGCWDGPSCAGGMKTPVANMDGDYTMTKLTNELGMFGAGSIFDRSSTSNPFRDFNLVFVPYCTGDFHSGDKHADFGVDHRGSSNLDKYLARIVPTYCDAERVVLAGTSAGGFGAMLNFDKVKKAFPAKTPMDLIDDSGPLWRPTYGGAKQTQLRTAWGGASTSPTDCSGCGTAWHELVPFLAKKYPESRISIVSSQYDVVIGPYFGLGFTETGAAMNDLADNVVGPVSSNVKVFYVYTNEHTWLGRNLASVSTKGVTLSSFLGAQISGSTSWASVRP